MIAEVDVIWLAVVLKDLEEVMKEFRKKQKRVFSASWGEREREREKERERKKEIRE